MNNDNAGKVGTAEWMDPIKAPEVLPYEEDGFWLGRSPVDDNQEMGFQTDRHILLCAKTRSGKGRSLIINNLALWKGSVVSIDPKGENALIVANRRGQGSDYCRGLGQKVFVLDPFNAVDPARVGPHMRGYYNPLEDVDPRDPELPGFAAQIAESMLMSITKEDESWGKRGGVFIEAVILHVLTSDDFIAQERNLFTVRRLIMEGDYKAVEAITEATGTCEVPGEDLLFEAMLQNMACGGTIRRYTTMLMQSKTGHSEGFLSIKQAAVDNTAWLESPAMQRMIMAPETDSDWETSWGSARTFSLSHLKYDPKGISIFLCLSTDEMDKYGRWQRMMVQLLFSRMRKTQQRPVNGHRVLFSLDEFAALGKFDAALKAAPEIAGSGVQLFAAVQGLYQLKEIYGERWRDFAAQAGARIFFDIDGDDFTYDYLNKQLGQTEIRRIKRSGSTSEASSKTKTKGTTKSKTWQESTARMTGHNRARTETFGTSWGSSNAISSGKTFAQALGTNLGFTTTSSDGTSSSRGYGPHILFEPWHRTSNYGKTRGTSVSRNKSAANTSTRSENQGRTYTINQGGSRSEAATFGESQSTTCTYAQGGSNAESQSTAHGRTTTDQDGWQEEIVQRPLLTVSEANETFSRVDDPEHLAYPGLSLVTLSGHRPVVIRRGPQVP